MKRYQSCKAFSELWARNKLFFSRKLQVQAVFFFSEVQNLNRQPLYLDVSGDPIHLTYSIVDPLSLVSSQVIVIMIGSRHIRDIKSTTYLVFQFLTFFWGGTKCYRLSPAAWPLRSWGHLKKARFFSPKDRHHGKVHDIPEVLTWLCVSVQKWSNMLGNLRTTIYPSGSSWTPQKPNKKHCGGEKIGRAIVLSSSSSSVFLYKSDLVHFSVNVCKTGICTQCCSMF